MNIAATVAIRNHIPQATIAVRAALVEKLAALGEDIVTRAQANLYPGHGYDTGELQQSISFERIGMGGLIHVDAPYALYVEWGTVHMAAIPFLRPAIAQVWSGFDKYFSRALTAPTW